VRSSTKYNSQILCLSSLLYLLAGLMVIEQSLLLSIIIFAVTLFSILHHAYHKNLLLTVADWLLAIWLVLHTLYIFRDTNIVYIFLLILIIFKSIDEFIFFSKRYRMFNYSHSIWHLLSSLAIILLSIYA